MVYQELYPTMLRYWELYCPLLWVNHFQPLPRSVTLKQLASRRHIYSHDPRPEQIQVGLRATYKKSPLCNTMTNSLSRLNAIPVCYLLDSPECSTLSTRPDWIHSAMNCDHTRHRTGALGWSEAMIRFCRSNTGLTLLRNNRLHFPRHKLSPKGKSGPLVLLVPFSLSSVFFNFHSVGSSYFDQCAHNRLKKCPANGFSRYRIL